LSAELRGVAVSSGSVFWLLLDDIAGQPDDPLEFMVQKLQEGQTYNAEVVRDRPPTAAWVQAFGLSCVLERGGLVSPSRSRTCRSAARPATSQGKEDEVLATMRAEKDHWQRLYSEEAKKVGSRWAAVAHTHPLHPSSRAEGNAELYAIRHSCIAAVDTLRWRHGLLGRRVTWRQKLRCLRPSWPLRRHRTRTDQLEKREEEEEEDDEESL
jgi:hypothetical protein